MTVLYIEGKVGDFTVYLEPIEKPRFITLRNCAFYNRWKNLSVEGTVSDGENTILRIPAGNYTLETLKRQIDAALSLGEKAISINVEKSLIKAHQNVVLNNPLTDLLNLKNKELKAKTEHEIQLKALDAIYIHCDLVKPSDVLKQGCHSQILSCVELEKGKINFSSHSPIQNSAISCNYMNRLRFAIKDGDGNIIENIYPMRLTVEIT